MTHAERRKERIAHVVCGVIRQAAADAGAEGVLLSEADARESGLAREWCEAALGAERVAGAGPGRLLRANAASKTTLLLCAVPPAAILPLGDLFGSELLELGADWSPPPLVEELAGLAGGADVLDRVLRQWTHERQTVEAACRGLPVEAREPLRTALAANRFARRFVGLVPKLTSRTLGIDLWE
jgi:hypothetical protein